MYNIARVTVPDFTNRPRKYAPSIICIHATRGHTSMELQDESVINWFAATPDRGGWGSTADFLVSSDGAITQFRDIDAHYGAYAAGYGQYGPPKEYAVDEHAISIEVAQPAYNRGEQPPMFTPDSLAAAAWLARHLSDEYDIPLVKIPFWYQLRSDPVPRGLLGHEDTANGKRLGKHDPGPAFNWGEFLKMCRNAYVEPLTAAGMAKIYTALYLGRYPGLHVKWGDAHVRDDGWTERRLLTKGI
jgi:hypothetical protein